jgi:hypothetical protein
MHEIALIPKCLNVDIVHASKYVDIRSLRSLAETSVSNMNCAL